jgi:hypothetical protein
MNPDEPRIKVGIDTTHNTQHTTHNNITLHNHHDKGKPGVIRGRKEKGLDKPFKLF